MNEMHHEPTSAAPHTDTNTTDADTTDTTGTADTVCPGTGTTDDHGTGPALQLTLDLPEVESRDDGTIDLQRFRLDEHTRELGRRQVALIKAQLAERAAQRSAA